MTFKHRLHTLATLPICAGVLFAGAWIVGAGDLNPPVGPVAPTAKPLAEIEPRIAINATNTPGDADSVFKITLRGSYYLTGNISGVAAKNGVKITASGVNLDLNGFDLVGVAGSLDGVLCSVSSLTNIAVINGSVRNWGDEGVDLQAFSATNCRVDDLLASGNGGQGIAVSAGGTVTNCSAYLNSSNGIFGGNGCTITNCSALSNGSNGISTLSGCTVSNCSASQNSSSGIITSSGCTVTGCSARLNDIVGISVVTGCTVTSCSARENTIDGIACISGCIIRGNTCSTNGNGAGNGAGINANSNDNRIEGNNCTGADRGIEVNAAGNIIIKNACSGNSINWDIAANNVCGPIVDRVGAASAAILGNSAPDSTGSTHPNANFSY